MFGIATLAFYGALIAEAKSVVLLVILPEHLSLLESFGCGLSLPGLAYKYPSTV